MPKYAPLLLLILFLISACRQLENTVQQSPSTLLDPEAQIEYIYDYPAMINEAFTGELAYQTTAFVEKYWRVVGNEGFNKSIYEVVRNLESAGYVLEENATEFDRLTYRIEKRPLENPTWEPVDASLMIAGESEPLLTFATNRNMIAQNSFSANLEAEVVYIENPNDIDSVNVRGKIVFAEMNPYYIYKKAIEEGAAAGIITYDMPAYLQPEKNTTSIQFRRISLDETLKPWGIALSYQAKERLKSSLQQGETRLKVNIETNIYPSEELTVVAEIKGHSLADERLVFSAHVQEPGANDNASGVGVALEMATVIAGFIKKGDYSPRRTLTFLWGDEIISTNRYVKEDSVRADGIKWGISLDMVGENTSVTGGTFLIEKMPDPSAIWTRGNDEHSEWGGDEMTLEEMTPHYLNDFIINRFKAQGERNNWVVKTNPFEGGSDHVPFLRADIPGLLLWHFTDQFYHTDNDRIENVSQSTLKNVGAAALISAFELLNAGHQAAIEVMDELVDVGTSRLKEELHQGKIAIKAGATIASQEEIIRAWEDWYIKAIATTSDMVRDEAVIQNKVIESQKSIKAIAEACILEFRNSK